MSFVSTVLFVAAAVCFILGLKMLSRPETARRGNLVSACGMGSAVLGTALEIVARHPDVLGGSLVWVLIGLAIGAGAGIPAARLVKMTQMPEMVALLNGFGGLASLLVAWAQRHQVGNLAGAERLGEAERLSLLVRAGVNPGLLGDRWGEGFPLDWFSALTIVLAALIGGVTFTGSLVAWGKLSERFKRTSLGIPNAQAVNAVLAGAALLACLAFVAFPGQYWLLLGVIALSLYLGLAFVVPIGGADMPVVISLLNSYSGLAACAAGFAINSPLLIITGSLVGASGIILTRIMCMAMNRSLRNVLFVGFGTAPSAATATGDRRDANVIDAEQAYYRLEAARRVVIVPGYGMAVAQAQHAVKELADLLEANGTEVSYAIHPVAGRMPGHMSVLLAEANVPYEQLVDMNDINPQMGQVDVAVVIGANDTVNPDARDNPRSALAGMPIIEVDRAQTVFVLKRSLGAGYAGVENPLFFKDNTAMVLGDAKKTVEALIGQFKEA